MAEGAALLVDHVLPAVGVATASSEEDRLRLTTVERHVTFESSVLAHGRR